MKVVSTLFEEQVEATGEGRRNSVGEGCTVDGAQKVKEAGPRGWKRLWVMLKEIRQNKRQQGRAI